MPVARTRGGGECVRERERRERVGFYLHDGKEVFSVYQRQVNCLPLHVREN